MSGETLDRSVNRRAVLGGAAAAAAAVGVSACASGATPDTQAAPTGKAVGIGGATPAAATGSGEVGKVTDVPVGGGKIFNQAIVVTQPAAGTFKAFNATCTHNGCAVNEVNATGISCPCHGSIFSINDGSVIQGPAKKPLAAMQVTSDNGTLKVT